jgi:spermidine synthase/uncharacterized membrane protein
MNLESALYALLTFISAFLLFLLEPIAARELLPLFGGSAAVWTTCLVFFQGALLAGYWYAHLLMTKLSPRWQTRAQIALLSAAVVTLVVTLVVHVRPSESAVTFQPIFTLLWMLTATIGLPFLALAANSPMLQAWYVRSRAAEAAPWWLYALSNAGSLLALLLYPSVVESQLTLTWQLRAWDAGFCLFAALGGTLALHQRRLPIKVSARESGAALPVRRRMLWIALPACGSMLLCAVTNHLGANIAPIPLVWIIPLAAYLVSFIVAFSSPKAWPRFLSVRMLAVTLATFAYLFYHGRYSFPLVVSIPVYSGALLFCCLFCHAELYRLRPVTGAVTGYYLHVALGSAAGAVLVGIAAPNLFEANHDLAIAVVLLALTALVATWQSGVASRLAWTAAAIGLIYVGRVQAANLSQDALVQVRSFYGALRVTETHLPPDAETTRTLFHGRIQHGTQLFGNGLRTLPSSYYGRNSGVGLALDLCCEGRPRRIGVVGLGTGTVAAYGKAGDEITFYEIDPLVERLARALFTYLGDSQAKVKVVPGDARLSIASENASPFYDVLVLDAFSGDAIPVHLLTADAIALYRGHLRPDGVLVFHISSQYLDLAPQLVLQARNAGMKAVLIHSSEDEARGIFAADWVLLSANNSLLTRPEIVNASQSMREIPGLRLWTDEYSSLLPLLRWRGGIASPTRP